MHLLKRLDSKARPNWADKRANSSTGNNKSYECVIINWTNQFINKSHGQNNLNMSSNWCKNSILQGCNSCKENTSSCNSYLKKDLAGHKICSWYRDCRVSWRLKISNWDRLFRILNFSNFSWSTAKTITIRCSMPALT